MTITPIPVFSATPQPPVARGTAPPPAAAPQPAASLRKLRGNPLFVDGSNFDEFQLNGSNLVFAQKQFGLDQDFVDVVKSNPSNARFSVVYHTDDKGVHVDAYRTAAAVSKGSVFAAYTVKDPAFDPGKVYRNEISTPMGGGRYFGTVLVSKRLALPDSADPAARQFLKDNGYVQKETIPVGQLKYPAPYKKYFGLNDKMGIQMFDPEGQSFSERFKIFAQLFKASPEYRAYKVGDTLGTVGAAVLLGVITPKLWEQGTAYGIASTITSIANIGEPGIQIVGESLLGSVVDNAVNSDRPLDNLKKISLASGALETAKVGGYLALHPQVISHVSAHPGTAFVGLYAMSAVTGTISGVINGKADLAIHDQLINKADNIKTDDYAKNFYQIMGVESSISSALYLGAYSATVAAVSAAPHVSLPLAMAGAGVWGVSNFVWPLFHEKPEVRTTIEGSAFIHDGDRYVFDSGWEVSFKGGQGKIVQNDANHFAVSMGDGELYMKNDLSSPVSYKHKRRLKDYLPKFLKPKMLGEKEHWELGNGEHKVSVSRYGNSQYHLHKVSDGEYVLTQNGKPDPFWKA